MSKPSVNVVLRLDSSKVKDDAEKAKSILTTSIGPTVDVFNVAEKSAQLFGKALEFAGKGLVFLTERTGAAQALASTLEDTRKAIGEAADRSGALTQAMGAIEKAARELGVYFRSAEGREAVNGFFKAISTGAANGLDAMLGLYRLAQDLSFEIEGRVKGVAVRPLEEPEWLRSAQTLADRLRTSGTNRPENEPKKRGSYVDEEEEKRKADARKRAIDDRKKADADLEKSIDAALRRAEEQRKERLAIENAELDGLRKVAEIRKTIDDNVTEYQARNAERRAELREKEALAVQASAENYASVGKLMIDGSSYVADGMDRLSRSSEAMDENTTLAAKAGIAVSGVFSSVFQSMAQAIGSGEDIGKAVAVALGGAIASLGASAVAAGTFAVVMGSLALAFPPLQTAFPSSGIPGGLAAIALGGAMLAGGTYLSMIASGGSATPGRTGGPNVPSAAGSRGTGFSGTPQGFQDTSGGGSRTTILSYNFNGPMGGSPRRIAREIRDLTTAGDTLLPGFRPVGGR